VQAAAARRPHPRPVHDDDLFEFQALGEGSNGQPGMVELAMVALCVQRGFAEPCPRPARRQRGTWSSGRRSPRTSPPARARRAQAPVQGRGQPPCHPANLHDRPPGGLDRSAPGPGRLREQPAGEVEYLPGTRSRSPYALGVLFADVASNWPLALPRGWCPAPCPPSDGSPRRWRTAGRSRGTPSATVPAPRRTPGAPGLASAPSGHAPRPLSTASAPTSSPILGPSRRRGPGDRGLVVMTEHSAAALRSGRGPTARHDQPHRSALGLWHRRRHSPCGSPDRLVVRSSRSPPERLLLVRSSERSGGRACRALPVPHRRWRSAR